MAKLFGDGSDSAALSDLANFDLIPDMSKNRGLEAGVGGARAAKARLTQRQANVRRSLGMDTNVGKIFDETPSSTEPTPKE